MMDSEDLLAAIVNDLNNAKWRLQRMREGAGERMVRDVNRALYHVDGMQVSLKRIDSILAKEGENAV